MSPRSLYARIAVAEVASWALLLLGMVHGVVFIAFCLITVVVAVNQRWSVMQAVLGLASAVPPFLTVCFERRMERRGRLDGNWRLGHQEARPENPLERVLHALMARPAVAVVLGLVIVACLTGLALVVGPPVQS